METSSFLRKDSGSHVGWVAIENVSSGSCPVFNEKFKLKGFAPPPRDLIFLVPNVENVDWSP